MKPREPRTLAFYRVNDVGRRRLQTPWQPLMYEARFILEQRQ